MESPSLQNGSGRGKRYKEEEREFPIALVDLKELQNVLLELQTVQDEFPLTKTKEKGPTCHINKSGVWQKPLTARC